MGDDPLWGNVVTDRLLFRPSEGQDSVTGYADGADRIDLGAFQFADASTVIAPAYDAPWGMLVNLAYVGGGTVFLDGFSLDALDATDMILG